MQSCHTAESQKNISNILVLYYMKKNVYLKQIQPFPRMNVALLSECYIHFEIMILNIIFHIVRPKVFSKSQN